MRPDADELRVHPVAYRLDAGPFLRLGLSESGVHMDFGNDARMLLILGAGNQLPPGIAINLLALGAFTLLIATHRAGSAAPAG